MHQDHDIPWSTSNDTGLLTYTICKFSCPTEYLIASEPTMFKMALIWPAAVPNSTTVVGTRIFKCAQTGPLDHLVLKWT